MALDVNHLFNEVLPAALARNADDAKTINAKYQLNITGVGEWFVDVTASGPSCTPGSQPADCTITVAGDDLEKLIETPGAAMTLFFSGKLKVTGNQMLGMKLNKLLAYK